MLLRLFAEARTFEQSKIAPGDLPNQRTIGNGDIEKILGIVFPIVGALALIIIVIAGLRYISAAGDPQKTASAKNTIFYALLGLVLAIMAQAIVAFTVNNV